MIGLIKDFSIYEPNLEDIYLKIIDGGEM